jgi:hypothetical protein
LPGWVAVIEQAPPERTVTVLPLTAQTAAVTELKDTGSPEPADAPMVKGGAP